jgi:hypothetical protein
MSNLCKNCGINESIKYSEHSNGEFCSKKCALSFSTKSKRNEINEKISKKLKGKNIKPGIEKVCPNCNKQFVVKMKRKNQICCSVECSRTLPSYKEKMSVIVSKRVNNENEKIRLREIGRKGGFGKKGYTSNGVFYQSTFERKVFEFLDSKNVFFEPHKNIPNSTKISDLYIPHLDLWIELDGIDRDKKKKWIGKDYDYWLEKIEIYKNQKLNFKVIKTFNEFLNNIVL